MRKDKSPATAILRDLEEIYAMAIDKENFAVALKAKELLGREQGLFTQKAPRSKEGRLSFNDLSEEDLNCLIRDLERQLRLDLGGNGKQNDK